MARYAPGVRSLDYFEAAQTMIVGTRGSEIIEFNATTGAKLKTLIYGHFEGAGKQAELWGCAVHPTEQLFATCGADMTVRVWNATTMVAVSEQFLVDLTAIDWSKSGLFLIAGDRNGYIHGLDSSTLAKTGGVAKAFLAD